MTTNPVRRTIATGDADAVDRFDRVALDRLLVRDVRLVKIWRADGTIVYSDDVRLIGERFPLGAEERDVMQHGGSRAEVSDLTRPENRYEAGERASSRSTPRCWPPAECRCCSRPTTRSPA